jgi:hypothetical protein
MGPLSAIAAAFSFVMVGLTWIGAITAGLEFLGWVLIISAVVFVLDTFWFGSGTRYAAWRGRA